MFSSVFFLYLKKRRFKGDGNVLVSGFLGAQDSCGVTEGFPREETRVPALRNFYLTFFW